MWKLKLLIFAIITFFCLVVYFYYQTEKECLSYEFKGIVENVKYNEKGGPTVLINGINYDLPVNFWAFNYKIQKGDSLVKQRNEMTIKLFKQKTGEVIFFK